jgi:hypothetical protein
MSNPIGATSGVSPLAQLYPFSLGTTQGSAGDTAPDAEIMANAAPNASATMSGNSSYWSSIAPDAMNALLSAQAQGGAASPQATSLSSQLFSLLDSNGDGQISKSEFETALGQNGNTTKADQLFAKLDSNGDGSVSQSELSQALQSRGGHHHHHHQEASGTAPTAADLGGLGSSGTASAGDNSATDLGGSASTGNSSQQVTNADGSTTTTVEYADGTQVTMTVPAAQAGAGPTSASHDFLKQLVQYQANLFAAPGQSLALNI